MPNTEHIEQANYLKVEAINIYKTLLDTNQLSVIRGSSHIIKEAINEISSSYTQLDEITVGGSIGVFKILTKEDPHAISHQILSQLCEHPLYKLFTFSVDTVAAKSYLEAKEKLIALGRLHQMRHLTYPTPQHLQQPEQGICAYNGFLPGYEKGRLPGSKDFIASPSVISRFNKGRELRSKLYQDELNDSIAITQGSQLNNYHFSENLEQLAGSHRNIMLSGKVAVIYVDGNRFSKAQRELLLAASGKTDQEIQKQKDFDKELRKSRADYLHSLLAFLVENKAYIEESDRKIIQLETLLWGGDEMTIVVPAWIGFKTLQHFFKSFENFSICGKPLSHAAGIVFCRASTPITKSQHLAIDLADRVKETPNGRDHNLFDYAVLESVDYMTDNDLNSFWKTQYLGLAKQRVPLYINTKSNLEDFSQHLEALPRSAIYHLVKLLIQRPVDELCTLSNITQEQRTKAKPSNSQPNVDRQAQLTEHINIEYSDLTKRIDPSLLALFEALFTQKPNKDQPTSRQLKRTHPIFWLHLLELYDYLDPENPNQTEATTTQEVSYERA